MVNMQGKIWIEQLRPQNFQEIIGHDKITSRLKAFIETKNMPHLLFSGPAGVGKTTLALIIAKQLFPENWGQNFLELNASDERGIDTIREKVKDFARTRAIANVPFKVIYLDECDSLTRDAQQALRRTMENYSDNCRFILSCNYSSKIIEPIQSRCTIFRFKPLNLLETTKLVKNICNKEGIKIDDLALAAIYEFSKGDLRRTINVLQSSAVIGKNVTQETIYEVVSAAKPKEINEVLNLCLNSSFVKAKDLLLDVMLKHGLSGLDVIKQIQSEILNLQIEDLRKIKMIEKCGEIEFRMVEGSDEFVQLESLLAGFCQVK